MDVNYLDLDNKIAFKWLKEELFTIIVNGVFMKKSKEMEDQLILVRQTVFVSNVSGILIIVNIWISLFCLLSSFTQIQMSPAPSNLGTFSRFNPVNRLLGWFRRPKNAAANSFDNNSDKEFNFNNPFAKESTSDKIIEDAISKHILEESKEQQVAAGSSPFILVVDGEDEMNLQSERNKRSKSGSNKRMTDKPTDTIPLEEALRIVSTASLTDCVARVVCELSCNANSYGSSGRAVFRNLIKLQFDQTLKGDDIKYFRQAASKGRQLVQAKKDCNECYTIYPSCKSSSNDLVAVSSMFKL